MLSVLAARVIFINLSVPVILIGMFDAGSIWHNASFEQAAMVGQSSNSLSAKLLATTVMDDPHVRETGMSEFQR